jgi:hypothetical protein
MTLTWFWLLWLIVGLACAVAGLWLTERRIRVTRLARRSRGLFYCGECDAPCEPEVRFCSICGRSIQGEAHGKHERISPSC